MMVTELFKDALVATAHVEDGIVAVCVIHKDQPQAVFEMRIDKLDDFMRRVKEQVTAAGR